MDTMEAIEEDIDENDLFHDLYEEDEQNIEATRLSELVRKQYLKYLEKQLNENLQNSCFNEQNEDYAGELYEISIKRTAQLLEDKAVKACMIAKFYQRAMIKIIAIVRRSTREKKLMHQLERCLHAREESTTKATQTETSPVLHSADIQNSQIPTFNGDYDKPTISLDDKIKLFEDRLKKEKYLEVAKKHSLTTSNGEYKKTKTYHQNHNTFAVHHPRRYRHHNNDNRCLKPKEEIYFSPTPSIEQPTTPITPPPALQQANCPETAAAAAVHSAETKAIDDDYANDSVALELARLFSEEKTELDEIFGIDPNDEPDDPQICKILTEIRAAKINQVNNDSMQPQLSPNANGKDNVVSDPNNHLQQKQINSFADIDLSKSIWPCELFMQKRMLSESLVGLLEEDLRWHDIMKWKFLQLFGEDSDDEFTPCSPSIELNEVLMGSCIRRISPWIVKHLMKPMHDGLIGNRFLFKKLAKHLARSIIMENQYPDEALIKNYVENFFCLHQAVMSLEDLEVDMPSISSL